MPSPPSPPALLTAAASAGVLALPIGACRIGHLRFSLSVRALEGHMLPPLALPPSVAERASAVRVPVAVAQDAAGEGAGVLLILEQHLAVDDCVCDAFRGLLDAPAAGREVVHTLFLAALHGGGIENRDVRRPARPQQAAVLEAKGRCRVEGQAAHRLLQAQHLLLAYPFAEQLGDIAVAAVN